MLILFFAPFGTGSGTQQLDEDIAMRKYCKKTIIKMKLKKRDSGHRQNTSRQKPEFEDPALIPQQLVNLLKMKAFREKLKTVKTVMNGSLAS